MIFDDAKEKNKHAVATPEDQNTLHSLKIPRLPLSTRRVLTLSKRTTTTTDRQTVRNHLKNNFVLFFPEGWIHCWVWVIGGHDSSPCSNSPIKFEHEFASQRFFCFATGCWRGYGRNFGRELWKEIYTQRCELARTIFFFTKKIPKKCTPTGDRELVSKPLATYIITLLRTCINCNEFRLIRKRE